MQHPFTDSELVELLEVSRYALADADIFDGMAEKLDLSDTEMLSLRDRLHDFLNPKEGGFTNEVRRS